MCVYFQHMLSFQPKGKIYEKLQEVKRKSVLENDKGLIKWQGKQTKNYLLQKRQCLKIQFLLDPSLLITTFFISLIMDFVLKMYLNCLIVKIEFVGRPLYHLLLAQLQNQFRKCFQISPFDAVIACCEIMLQNYQQCLFKKFFFHIYWFSCFIAFLEPIFSNDLFTFLYTICSAVQAVKYHLCILINKDLNVRPHMRHHSNIN